MTFEEIQKTLGEEQTNKVVKTVLDLVRQLECEGDTQERRVALRELLTAMLALVVTDRDPKTSVCEAPATCSDDAPGSTTEQGASGASTAGLRDVITRASDRFVEVADAMCKARDTMTPSLLTVH